jgi:hypothetical protein
MAITVKHSKVSTIPDDADTSLVRPSDWNADHALTGVIDVANGGTGASTLTGYVKGNGTSAMTAVATVPSTDITGLGTMSTQNANAVAVTGGTIDGTTIGATTASTGAFTTATASTSFGSPIFKATSSAGGALQNSGGTNQLQWGGGGGNNLSLDVATNINPANAQVDISPTGTGTVRINPATAGTIDNTVIGGTTPAAGTFTTLTSSGTATLANGSTTYVTVTGDASYPMIKATGGTNTPLVLSPLGTGALQAQKTDSTATGGNARGANAVDWQTSRNTAAAVASGQVSVVGGGYGNRATAFASVVAGGYLNQETNQGFVGGGSTNGQAGTYGFIGAGTVNNIGSVAYGSVIAGGSTNTVNGYFNGVLGGFTNSGTSGSAVTTQSGTMNGTTAVTLSGSNANIKVGQLIVGTSISFPDTYVAAISGTSLTLSKNASGSSTSTLSFFTPHGVVVGGGNNQATGSYSFIGGGGDAGTSSNRNVASGDWSAVVGGRANTATGTHSFIGGGGIYIFGSSSEGNIASGTNSFVGAGGGNNASGSASSILGGRTNIANGFFSSVIGAYGTARGITGNIVLSASSTPIGTFAAGSSQSSLLVLGKQTTDATATVITSDGSAASSTNQVILPNNSAYFFTGEVVSGVTGGGDTKGWTIEGVIKRGANAASTALVGTPTVTSMYADLGAATWAIAVTADTTNGGLRVTFTGQAATTIRTVCQIRTTEMTY